MNEPIAIDPETTTEENVTPITAEDIKVKARETAEDLKRYSKEKAVHYREVASEKTQAYREVAEEKLDTAKEKFDDIMSDAEDYVKENPIKSLLAALGVGLILGKVLK